MAEIGVMKKLTIGGSTYTIPEYNLPIASASTLGGVKIGTGLSINSTTGVLSATGLDYDEADPVFTASAAYGIASSDISNWNSKTSNTGTVTSVRVQASSPLQSSTSTAQSSTLNTTISFTNQNKNLVLAGPSTGNAAAPTFRALVAADIPDLSGTYLTSYTETDPTVPSWAKAETKPTYTASEVGALPSTTVIPSKTSDLTNDSGFITSYTDEKLKWTASTSSNTYYPLQSTSTATTSTANTLNSVSFYQYYNTAGGYRRLILGNTTSWKSSGGAYGTIRLYGAAATYYGDLIPGVLGTTSGDGHLTANRTWTLPDKTGTVALTSDIPTVPTNISAFTNDSGYITSADVPEGASAYTGTISAVTSGDASAGNNNGFARGDHTHNITKATINTVLGTGSGTAKFYREDGTWATPAYKTSATNSATGITASTTANKTTVGSSSTDYGVTAAGSGSFSATVTSHVLSFSHGHTAPTLGSKVPTVSTASATVTITDNGHTHTLS